MSDYKVIHGSAHHIPEIADQSIHSVICSPPYFGLRSFDGNQSIEWSSVEYAPMPGLPPLTIQGCDPGCEHKWLDEVENALQDKIRKIVPGRLCILCKGWFGPLGLEPTIEAYIGHLILCLREWRRVLRDDGLCFVNLGDSYASSAGQTGRNDGGRPEKGRGWAEYDIARQKTSKMSPGLKAKDLMMVPARFALAAQADGWWLRSALPWLKRNGMPESATDRPSQVVESVFILAKSESYFFDMEAVKQPATKGAAGSTFTDGKTGVNGLGRVSQKERTDDTTSRNLRSSDLFFKTWQGLLTNDEGDPLALVINPQPYSASHFAVFPPLLPEIAIKASTSERGCCANCGAAWKKVVERTTMEIARSSRQEQMGEWGRTQPSGTMTKPPTSITTGWAPSCICHGHFQDVDDGEDWITEETGQRRTRRIYVSDEMICAECQGTGSSIAWVTHKDTQSDEQWQASAARHPCPVCKGSGGNVAPAPVPCTVLDPFAGSGTTLQVAVRLGRHAIGVDLSESYLADLVPVRMDEVSTEPKRLTGGTEDWSEFALFADVA